MKATELMIGDWVEPKNPYKIFSIHENTIGGYKPIPLTEDILKANRWESTPTGDMYIYMPLWDEYMVEVLPSEGANIFRFLNKQGLVDMYKESIVLHFHYVHELQHALRLCGLSTLADNFKIV